MATRPAAASLRRLPPLLRRRPPRPPPRRSPGRHRAPAADAGESSGAPCSAVAASSRRQGGGVAVGPEGRARRSARCGRPGRAGAGTGPRAEGEGPGRQCCLAAGVFTAGVALELPRASAERSPHGRAEGPACPPCLASPSHRRLNKWDFSNGLSTLFSLDLTFICYPQYLEHLK